MSVHQHKDLTIKEATPSERDASIINRYGSQYYPVDPSYDKRVYENTGLNWLRIIGSLILFWFLQALHWWAALEFGIYNSPMFMIYSIIIFVCVVIFGGCLLYSGKFANYKKRRHEFYLDKINDIQADEQDRLTREKQDREYKEKIRLQEKKQATVAINADDAQVATSGAPAAIAPAANTVSPDDVLL